MPITTIVPFGTPYQSIFQDLRGGLNNSVTDELIQDNELSAVENFVPDIHKSGGLIKRNGVTKESSLMDEAITSVFDGTNGDYFTTSTSIRNLSGTSLLGSLTSSTEPDWATFDDASLGLIDVFVNGAEPRYTANGSSFSALSGIPVGVKYIEPFANGFLFAAGHDSGKLRWCAQEDATSWNAVQEIIVTAEDDPIKGLVKFAGSLIVLCERSFHHIGTTGASGNLGFRITDSNPQVGTTSHRSIVKSPFGLYWWSSQGFIRSQDGFRIDNPSLLKIPDTLRNLNKAQYENIHGTYDIVQESIQMFVHSSASTTHDKNISYYPGELDQRGVGSFWVGTGGGVEMSASGVILSLGESKVYTGSASSDGYLYEQTGLTDDGTNITAFFDTKRETANFGEEVQKRAKQLTHLVLITANTPLTYSVFIDDDDDVSHEFASTATLIGNFVLDTSALDTGRLGSGTTTVRTPIRFGRKWRKMKHRIEDSTAFQTQMRGVLNKGTVLNA